MVKTGSLQTGIQEVSGVKSGSEYYCTYDSDMGMLHHNGHNGCLMKTHQLYLVETSSEVMTMIAGDGFRWLCQWPFPNYSHKVMYLRYTVMLPETIARNLLFDVAVLLLAVAGWS